MVVANGPYMMMIEVWFVRLTLAQALAFYTERFELVLKGKDEGKLHAENDQCSWLDTRAIFRFVCVTFDLYIFSISKSTLDTFLYIITFKHHTIKCHLDYKSDYDNDDSMAQPAYLVRFEQSR